jgi:hypothetical protein
MERRAFIAKAVFARAKRAEVFCRIQMINQLSVNYDHARAGALETGRHIHAKRCTVQNIRTNPSRAFSPYRYATTRSHARRSFPDHHPSITADARGSRS